MGCPELPIDAYFRKSESASSDSIAYGYNARSEVTSAAATTETLYNYAYSFDNIGNRTSATERGISAAYTSNTLNQYSLINDGAGYSPSYDLDGNMTTSGRGWTYTWDAENRLVTAVNGSTTLQFNYDYMSRRVQKTVTGGISERYVYDGFKQIERLDATNSNALSQKFIWSGETLLSVIDASTSTTYCVVQDANKNITELIDGNGTVAAHYEYSPFGKVTVANGAYASANPFRFSSEYADDETGLVYYNFRYYSSDLGRWLSKDPIAEQGGANLYVFVINNPLFWIDYLGLGFFKVIERDDIKTDRPSTSSEAAASASAAGFEVQYVPSKGECPTPCKIILVAAVSEGGPRIDATTKEIKTHQEKGTKGIPIPAHSPQGRTGNLSYEDSPSVTRTFEAVAICRDDTGKTPDAVLGSVVFIFNADSRKVQDIPSAKKGVNKGEGGRTYPEQFIRGETPTKIWNKAVDRWRSKAGSGDAFP